MIALLRVYEAMGYVMWELEVADPDFNGKLVRTLKGEFRGDGMSDADRTWYALNQASEYASSQPKR